MERTISSSGFPVLPPGLRVQPPETAETSAQLQPLRHVSPELRVLITERQIDTDLLKLPCGRDPFCRLLEPALLGWFRWEGIKVRTTTPFPRPHQTEATVNLGSAQKLENSKFIL